MDKRIKSELYGLIWMAVLAIVLVAIGVYYIKIKWNNYVFVSGIVSGYVYWIVKIMVYKKSVNNGIKPEMRYNDNNNIIITFITIDTNQKDVFKLIRTDLELISAITAYCRNLDQEIEIFDRKGNIIVTEKGYYCAFWEGDFLNSFEKLGDDRWVTKIATS